MKRAPSAVWRFLLFPSLLTLGGCNVNNEIERSLGTLACQSLEAQYSVSHDSLLTSTLEEVGEREAKLSSRPRLPYKFKVLDSQEVNALAIPFGRVYFLEGLLTFVESEDELAAVMGHELTHITKRHSLKAFKQDALVSLALSTVKSERYESLKTGAQIGYFLLSMRHSRKAEWAADRHSVEHALAAGYDPQGLVDFFQRLKAKYEKHKPPRLLVYFSTHPPTTDRLARARSLPALQLTNLQARMAVAEGCSLRFLPAQAARHYLEAASADKTNVSAWLGAAKSFESLGAWDSAARSARKALQAAPNSQEAQDLVERVATQAGGQPKAAQAEDKADKPALLLMTERLEKIAALCKDRLSIVSQKTGSRYADLRRESTGLIHSRQTLVAMAQQMASEDSTRLDPMRELSESINRLEQCLAARDEALEAAETSLDENVSALERLCGELSQPDNTSSTQELLRCGEQAWARSEGLLGDVEEGMALSNQGASETARSQRSVQLAADSLSDVLLKPDKEMAARLSGLPQLNLNAAKDDSTRALATSKEASRRLARAKTESLLNQIDTVTRTMTAEQRAMYARLLARQFFASEEDVLRLVNDGFSEGDTAVVFGMAKQTGKSASVVVEGHSFLSLWASVAYSTKDCRLSGLNVVLRLYSNNLLAEQKALREAQEKLAAFEREA